MSILINPGPGFVYLEVHGYNNNLLVGFNCVEHNASEDDHINVLEAIVGLISGKLRHEVVLQLSSIPTPTPGKYRISNFYCELNFVYN